MDHYKTCTHCKQPLPATTEYFYKHHNGLFGRCKNCMQEASRIPDELKKRPPPLCFGIGGCNNKKRDLLPEEWLVSQYGRKKANTILRKIEKYFAAVRERAILGP